MANSDVSNSSIWEILKKIGIVVAIVMPTIIAINAYTQLKKENVELTLNLFSSKDMLPAVNEDEEITATYKFRDSIVSELVLVTYEIINTGDVTLVGSGARSNLTGSRIKFVPNKPDKIYNDILIERNTPNAKVKFDSLNNLVLEFTQWKPGEKLVFSLYYSKNYYEEISSYMLLSQDRFLINGDIVSQIYTNESKDIEFKIYQGLDPVFRIVVIVVAVIILSTILVLAAVLYIIMVNNTIKYVVWNNSHESKVRSYLEMTPRSDWNILSVPKNESIDVILKNIDSYTYDRLRMHLNVPKREANIYFSTVWKFMYGSTFFFLGIVVLAIMILTHFRYY